MSLLSLGIDVREAEKLRIIVSGSLAPPLPCNVRIHFEGSPARRGLTGTEVGLEEPGSWDVDTLALRGSYEVEDKQLMKIPGVYTIWSEALTPPPIEQALAKSRVVDVEYIWGL